MDIPKEKLVEMYKRMVTIRQFEEGVARLMREGRIPGIAHLYAGEEAVAVGACAALGEADYIASTHRGHGHLIAKGGDPKRMYAELFGRPGHPGGQRHRGRRAAHRCGGGVRRSDRRGSLRRPGSATPTSGRSLQPHPLQPAPGGRLPAQRPEDRRRCTGSDGSEGLSRRWLHERFLYLNRPRHRL